MKRSTSLNRWGKTFMVALMSLVFVTFMACTPEDPEDPTPSTPTPSTPTPSTPTPSTPTPDDPTPDTPSSDPWAYLVNETPKDYSFSGDDHFIYGDHEYWIEGEIEYNTYVFNEPTAYVMFSNVPSGYTEFETVYNNFLGEHEFGAAAMIPMAFEIYARNNATGERCLNLLCNASTTVSEIVRILKTKLVPSPYAPENDQYIQRYLPADLLDGAVNTNAYKPIEPYTVQMCRSANAPQDAPLTGGKVYYLYILAHGWDSFQRAADIFQAYNSDMYKVFNCPATYTHCKNIIGTWEGLK